MSVHVLFPPLVEDAMDVESEIRDLKRRVGELEGTYGFLTGQLRDVHRAVLGFQEDANERFDGLDGRMDGIDGRMDRFEQGLDALPRALAEIVRAEFDRRDGKE
jgi:hypothetical protein